MKIAVIGAGGIGGALARNLSAAGHSVRIATSSGPAGLADRARAWGAVATSINEVSDDAEALIIAIPFGRLPELRPLLDRLPAGVPVADTSNHHPGRDGRIAELEDAMTQSAWVERQLGRPVVRAWNAVLQTTLAGKGRPTGAAERLAVPVAGTDTAAKQRVMGLVDDTGFDPVDAGTAEDAWRMQAGTPAYCTELDAIQLRAALADADPEAARVRREALLAILGTWGPGLPPFDDLVALNRAAARLR